MVRLPNPLELLRSHGIVDVWRRCTGSKIISRSMKSVPLKIRLCYCFPYSSLPSVETMNLLELNMDLTFVITPADVIGGEEIEAHLSIRLASEYYVILFWCFTSPRCISRELHALCCGGAERIHRRCGAYKNFIKSGQTAIAAFLFLWLWEWLWGRNDVALQIPAPILTRLIQKYVENLRRALYWDYEVSFV